MGAPSKEDLNDGSSSPNWPWWEPYLFTASVFAAVVVVLIVFGFIARIAYSEPIFLALMTAVAVVEVARRPLHWPSPLGNSSLAVLLGLASCAYFSQSNQSMAIGYAILAAIWFGLSIQAALARRRLRRERSAKLERAVDTLRAAVAEEN